MSRPSRTGTSDTVSSSDPDINDPVWRLQNLYLIKAKDSRTTRLKLNNIQKLLLKDIWPELSLGKAVRSLILKFRQGGVSTFFLLLHLDRTIFNRNITTGILADLRENLGYLFEIIRFAHESMPERYRPKLGSDSKSELTFPEIGSKIMVSLTFKATALHGLHVSEAAYIDRTDLERSLAACAPDAWVTKESTANGYNTFRDDWLQAGELGKPGLFLPWPLQEEYRIPGLGLCDDLPPLSRTQGEVRFAESMLSGYGITMDDAQFRYRRQKMRELRGLFQQEMAESSQGCFLASGGVYFDGNKIGVLIREAEERLAKEPPLRSTEELEVWESPQTRHVYVAGADVAGGKDNVGVDRDYSVLAVLCVTCRKTAARYMARVNHDSFYRTCHSTGVEYNRAMLAVERNNHGHAINLGLKESGYPNLYVQKRDRRYNSTINEIKIGWDTNAESKPRMLDQLRQALEGDSDEDAEHFQPDLVWLDTKFLKETLNVREEGGKISAVAGKHDDLVMAYAIAYQLFREARSAFSASDIGRIAMGDKLQSA